MNRPPDVPEGWVFTPDGPTPPGRPGSPAWTFYNKHGYYPGPGDIPTMRAVEWTTTAFCMAIWALILAVFGLGFLALIMAGGSGPQDTYGPGTGDTAPSSLCTAYWLSTHNGQC